MSTESPTSSDQAASPNLAERPTTVPENYPVVVRGLETIGLEIGYEDRIEEIFRSFLSVLGQIFDLSGLDGVTIAGDYAAALYELDRGRELSSRLTPSSGDAVGIAMTPAVLRGGEVRSHIVLNAVYVLPMMNEGHEYQMDALHTLAHECAHVEVTGKFNAAFPRFILQERHDDPRIGYRWQVIKACWDECAGTKASARMGAAPTVTYENLFLTYLESTRSRANEIIKKYRLDGAIDRVYGDVYVSYGALMKYAAYHLGNLAGLGLTLQDMPRTKAAIQGNWFEPFFEQLNTALQAIHAQNGIWRDKELFEVIGDIADDVVAEGGIYCRYDDADRLCLDIPYSVDTMPDEDEEKSR